MNPLSAAVLVMAGITAYVGLYHVFVYLRTRQNRRDLSFALLCLVIVGYDVACAGLYSATSLEEGVAWQYRQLVLLVLGSVAFLIFTADYTQRIPPRVIRFMMAYGAGVALFASFDRSDLVWDISRPMVKEVRFFGQEVVYHEAAPGPVMLLQSVVAVAVFAYAGFVGTQLYRDGGRREARPLLAALAIFFLGILSDSAVSMGLYNFVYTIEYAYMSVIVLMAYGLSDELVQASAVRERLAESEERLRQSQKMEALGTLAGGIAHDFNNLLSPILGHAELARERVDPTSEIAGDLDEISAAGQRAAQLTRQLLGVSRKQVPEPRVLDLNAVVAEFRPVLRHLVREDIEIQVRLSAAPCRAVADSGQLHQILMNLAVNASDAMPTGGNLAIETATADLDAAAAEPLEVTSGGYARLSVIDSGTGMSPEVARRIFEPFFTTKERGRGTGLGLATVRSITTAHGGGLSATSAEGEGARFDVYLPATDQPVAVGATGGGPPSTPKASGVETVLVAEDDHAVRELAVRILRRQGYEVVASGAPLEALELARDHPTGIDLLLTDVIMPRLSGRQLYESLAAENPGLKVLFMSGYAGDAVEAEGLAGSDGENFLQKPFAVPELARRVRAALDAH